MSQPALLSDPPRRRVAAPVETDEYRPDIDGLRAIAVIAVVIFHAAPTLLPGGFIGVDMFFVISGFLITGIILRQLQAGRFSLLGFYARRFRRIVPALALVLAATWILGYLSLLPEELANLGKHLAGGAWFFSNVLLFREAGYFDELAERKPLLHLWSLGVEEQYYLIWPLLLAFVFRRRLNVLAAIVMLFLVSFSLNVARVSRHSIATFYLLPTRFWELLIGGALAYHHVLKSRHPAAPQEATPTSVNGTPSAKSSGQWRAVLAIVLLVGCAFGFDSTSSFPGWRALPPTALTGALILSGPQAWLNRAVLGSRPLVLVGLMSYPLYLWHWPLLALSRIVEETQPRAWIRLAAVALSLGLAFLTWRLLERPIRRLRTSSRRQRLTMVASCLVVLSLIGGVGLLTQRARGFPGRHPAVEARGKDLQPFDGYAAHMFPCSGSLSVDIAMSWCWLSKVSAPTLAVFGDSHADHIFPGIALQDTLDSWLLIGQSACAPLKGVRSFSMGSEERCFAVNEQALKVLVSNPSIKTVVLSSLGPYYISQKGYAFHHRGALDASRWILQPAHPQGATPGKGEVFYDGLSATISQLQAAGKNVVVYLDTFEIPFLPSDCRDLRPLRISQKVLRDPCALPKAAVMNRQADYRALMARLGAAHPTVGFFDPLEFLCDDSLCYVQRQGQLYFRDSHHLSTLGSEYLAGPFLRFLRSRQLVP